ncbi:methyltransferase [Micromonospora sp. ANENR4]|uniref:methyltransferase n=1 Tax=unclassified Micromonospora TaxID=2617518 RepID=UPI00188E400E|nr:MULTISPECIES: methyltransferase [unclassified Micromonospora]MBF5029972.1 methyltransferase [Micromonospora sp. ANENR4]MCZ7474944.1 methyltransferase [Micromonospora sp. WMMC273]
MVARRADISAMLEMLPPFAVRVAATLRLSDHIADGHTGLKALARAGGADPDALGRLLRYLVQLGLYTEPEPGTYAVTPAGRMLATAHPSGLRAWLDLDGPGGRMDLALAGLLHAVRTGEPGYDRVHGRSFWDDLAADPARGDAFDALMAGKSRRVAADLAAVVPWHGTRHLVDVGGGRGATMIAVLGAHPGLRGTVFDLPGPAAGARAAVREAGLADRCDVVAGSFLDAVPEGDTHLLFDILHDWDDATAAAILRRCAAVSRRVLVVEDIPAGEPDRWSVAADLKMLTLFAGRQRTAAQLAALGAVAGLRAVHPAAPVALPGGFAYVEFRPGAGEGGTPA